MSVRRLYWISGFLFLCTVILLYPSKSTVVPAWRLKVEDENGQPVTGIAVNYTWQHYSIEIESHEVRTHTDAHGYVSFPERESRASLLQRGYVPVYNFLTSGRSASFGPYGHIVVWGRPDEFKTEDAFYDGKKPLPEKIILRRVNH